MTKKDYHLLWSITAISYGFINKLAKLYDLIIVTPSYNKGLNDHSLN